MKYIDNIIDWADYLFRLNTREYNNEATLLYILAKEILGKRPVMFPSKKLETNINYQSIKTHNLTLIIGNCYHLIYLLIMHMMPI